MLTVIAIFLGIMAFIQVNNYVSARSEERNITNAAERNIQLACRTLNDANSTFEDLTLALSNAQQAALLSAAWQPVEDYARDRIEVSAWSQMLEDLQKKNASSSLLTSATERFTSALTELRITQGRSFSTCQIWAEADDIPDEVG